MQTDNGSQVVTLTDLADRTLKISGLDAKFYQIDAIHASSIEMTDTVVVTLKKDGVKVESVTYSVASVAEDMLKNGGMNETAQKLLGALLQYGHYAQTYFTPDKESIPTIYPEAPELEAIPDDYAPKGDPTDFGAYIEQFTAALDCKEAVRLNIYLTPADGFTINDFEFTILDKAGNAYARYTEPKMKNGKIYIQIRGIYSNRMDNDFQIVVKLKSDSDVSATWTRSVITSAYEIYQTSTNDNIKNVTMAMYQYFLAAKEVFGE